MCICRLEKGAVSNGVVLNSVAESGWSVACTTVEEWNETIESLTGFKHAETKRLLRALQGTC